ncbi:hypothetical protein HCX48_07890 [Rhodocyclus tenuis]|uniref:Uncharacterized protein n=1 Tax=Rhodocyclus gracilis TaxID=2929842 RepID=A0ABX0WHE2_9RHOO|nr:hypothetical protein [Rhodocyclus gracilis]NJA89142.1 hypothetical protein [Rhodocyclus gracilis]
MRAFPVAIRHSLAAAICVVALGACSTISGTYPRSTPLLPNAQVQVTPSTALTFEQVANAAAVAGIVYVVYDPLAPNWTIREQALDAQNYVLSLRAKSFRIGGDGEAAQIFRRRAQLLQREKAYSGYRILDYAEGIESSTPFTHRTAEGIIQLVGYEAPSTPALVPTAVAVPVPLQAPAGTK